MSRTLQRFEGTSIESALTEAVTRLGPEVNITDARRVRSGGLLGFFAKERYEVVVEPTADPTGGAHLDETLQALVARVEAEEDAPDFGVALAAAGNAWPGLNGFIHNEGRSAREVLLRPADDVEPPPVLSPWPRPVAVPLPPPPAPVAVPLPPLPAPMAVPLPPLPAAADAPALPEPGDPPALPAEPRWSKQALRDLGVPKAVRKLLPVPDGAGDAEWTAALVVTLTAVLPAPVGAPDHGAAAVSGHGPESAVAIIRAGLAGVAPGVLHLEHGPVAATPVELTLAVRACLPR